METTCGFYDTDSNPSDVSGRDTGNLDEQEPYNGDDIKASDSANEYLFGVLRLTITGAVRTYSYGLNPRMVNQQTGKGHGLLLKEDIRTLVVSVRRTLLRRLDISVMRVDIHPDVFISEVYKLRDKLSDFDEVVSTERLTTIILDALPAEKYLAIKNQALEILA